MTLGRLLAIAVSAIFFVALAGVQAIHLRSAQAHLQRQLESLAQDAATSIGLSLGALLRDADVALAETIINPAFDRGHYQRIDFLAPGGDAVVAKRLPLRHGDYPAWFAELFPLHAPTAESLVSAGWRQLGRVRVTVHPRFAYEQLWTTARDTALYLLLIYAAALLALQLLLRGVLRPLAAVEAAAQAISARNFVELRLRPATRELARVVEAMNLLSRKVNEAIDAETRRAEKLQAAVYHDHVTGLLNARGFAARFASTFEGEHEPLAGAFALVELADLAAINRELGAERCDALLRGSSAPIEELAARSGGFAGRWTGARAALALPGLDAGRARAALGELRARVGLVLQEFGLEDRGRVHCGAGISAGGPAPLRRLVAAAEEALLEAREAGHGVVVLEAPAAAARRAPALETPSAVLEALEAEHIRLRGQVAYRMQGRQPWHTEIMARLTDASGTEVAAAQFMPVVAAHGMVERLDRGVISRVLHAARDRADSISVNVSMRSIERPEFVAWLAERLAGERDLAARLVFEVAEHGVVRNEVAAAEFAAMLGRAGAGFGIDHFGVHPESLALVRRLNPAYVKLAATHTPTVLADPGARFFVESLVRAARQLDVPVIAQNVETDAALQSLEAIGLAGFQGNLAGRPAPWPDSGPR